MGRRIRECSGTSLLLTLVGSSVPCTLRQLGSLRAATRSLIKLSIHKILWLFHQGLFLNQLRKSLAWSQDLKVLQSHHHQLGNLVQITCEVNFGHDHQGESAFESSSKVEAASSSKGSSTPRSTAASSSKVQILLDLLWHHLQRALRSQSLLKGAHRRRGPHIPGALTCLFFKA